MHILIVDDEQDIVETLKGYDPNILLNTASTELFSNRLGRQIRADETLESAGVWNGDYIILGN